MKGLIIIFTILFLLSCNNNDTMTVGKSSWMKNNLAVDHFRNGDAIVNIQSIDQWYDACANGIPAYCVVDDSMNSDGYLYNFWAVKDKRNVAPEGYRISTSEDWEYAMSIDSMQLDMVVDLYNENKLNIGKYWCICLVDYDSIRYENWSRFWAIRDTLVEFVYFDNSNAILGTQDKNADEGIGIRALEGFLNQDYLKHDTIFAGYYIRCLKE